MSSTELDSLKNILSELKTDLTGLKEKASSLNARIESNYLPSEEMAEELAVALKNYQEKVALLQKTGTAISISIVDSIDEIGANIEAAEKMAQLASKRQIVLDYFRLTAAAENVRIELEESKRILMEKCRLPADKLDNALEPYKLVVCNVGECDCSGDLTDDAFDLIEEQIGRPIARALDRKHLSIDTERDISEFLDGSCGLLEAENDAITEEYVQHEEPVNEIINAETVSNLENTTEEEVPEEKELEVNENAPFWSHFDGYVDDVTVSFEDVPASALGASKFINMAKQRPTIPWDLFIFGHKKFQEVLDLDCEEYSLSLSHEMASYLEKHGFLTDINITKGATTRSFKMLTSKGWACYSKADVVKYLGNKRISCVVAAPLRMKTADFTPANALRAMLIHDYFANRESKKDYMIMPAQETTIMFGVEHNNGELVPSIVPAVFEAGKEAEHLAGILDVIRNRDTEADTHIVAFSKEDISLVAQVLGQKAEDAARVKYCLASQPEVLLDAAGNEIKLDEKGSLIEESEEIALDPEKENIVAEEFGINEVYEQIQIEEPDAKEVLPVDSEESTAMKKEQHEEGVSYINSLVAAKRTPSDQEFYSLIIDILRGTAGKIFNEKSNIVQALLLAKAAATIDTNKKCQALYSQLLLAINAPLELNNYSSENLTSVLLDSSKAPEALTISAYMIAMLAPETPWDYGLKSQTSEILSSYEEYFPDLAAIKPLFAKLCTIREVIDVGFSETILSKLGSNSENEKIIRALSAQARDLLTVSTPKTRMIKLPPLYNALFGKESDLYACLEAIATGKKANRELVEIILEDYCEKRDGIFIFDEAKIEAKLDESWFAVNGEGSSFKLELDARPQAIRQIKNRLKIMKAWVEQLQELPSSKYDLSRVKKLRDEILSIVKHVRDNVASQEVDCKCVVQCMLDYIENTLSGDSELTANLFDELAITGVISLDKNRIPVLDDSLNSVRYFELWRRVLMHMISGVSSFEEAREEILGGGEDSELFDNLRQLEVIGEISGSLIETSPEQLLEAKKAADDRTTRFKEKLELAYTYDRISETEKENLAGIEAQHEKSFYELRDFGVWRQLLKALEKRIDELADIKLLELRKSLKAHRDKLAEMGQTSSILEEANILLEEKLNFAVTEEYINRFENGELEFSEDLQAVLGEQDNFGMFMSPQVYNPIYAECFKGKNGNFRNIANDYLQRHFPKDWTVRLKENSEKLIANWPIRKGSTTPAQIKDLFTGIGIKVTHAYSVGSKKEDIFRIEVEPTAKSMADYRHPISAFGTQVKSPMSVVVLYGNVPPKQLVDQITEMGLGGMTIVVLNFPVSALVRRQIAEEFHKTTGQNPFILIDQVLFLHLALHQETERLPIMLKCTLPFTTYQPFVRDGGPTADEMFCGRSKELATIKDPNGACVVYGGRQLGKTALLERAESLCMKPENRAYAVYCNILSCRSEQSMAEKVSEDVKKKTGLSLGKCSDIKSLSNAFEELFRTNKVANMLLLLDETDNFLESIASVDYAPLQPLIDLRRSTKNNFKFVLAGLHNVCRAKNATARNGVFGQLGNPLCVKPLSPTDALQLLSRPLRYLGFEIDRYPHLETILTNTNYYPGILQFFGYMLVETVSTQYNKYYRASDGNPPFTLQDDQLGAVMNSADLNRSIRDKFRWSLELDQRYFMIARCIAVLYYMSDEASNSWLGFSVDEIMGMAKDYGIKCLEGTSTQEYKNLLDEMVDMGILSKPESDKAQYRLRRNSFIDIIGSSFDVVDEDICRCNEEE